MASEGVMDVCVVEAEKVIEDADAEENEGDAEYAMEDDGFDDGAAAESAIPPVPPPHPESRLSMKGKGKDQSGAQHPPAALLKCCVCLVNPRAKKAVYCDVPCASDVKAAERDAARRSKHLTQKGSLSLKV